MKIEMSAVDFLALTRLLREASVAARNQVQPYDDFCKDVDKLLEDEA